jgi:hypothetical protein
MKGDEGSIAVLGVVSDWCRASLRDVCVQPRKVSSVHGARFSTQDQSRAILMRMLQEMWASSDWCRFERRCIVRILESP